MDILIAIVATIVALGCWIATIISLPGNWCMLLLAFGLSYWASSDQHLDVGTSALVSLTVLAIAGEIAEFAAGAVGANQVGGSRTGVVLATVGSIVGAIAGMLIGLPIPVVGSLVAAVVFGCAGAFGGAVLGERSLGQDWETSIRIGWGALFGKLLGTLFKVICGTAMLVLVCVAIWR